MSEETKPVLTAGEWADRDVDRDHLDRGGFRAEDWPRLRLTSKGITIGETESDQMWVAADLCPALAALALQRAGPDGGPLFTWEAVDALERVALDYRDTAPEVESQEAFDQLWRDVDALHRLAATLASLLPPRMEP